MMDNKLPRRILFLTSDLGGGTGDHLLSMIRYWDETQWQPEIISERPVTSRLIPDVPVDIIPAGGWLDRYPVAQFRRLSHIGSQVKKRDPAVVHCYFYWSIMCGRVLKKLGKIRFLVENREDEGYGWSKRDYALLASIRSWPDRVICVSEAVRQVVLERERLDPSRTLVVHNGVEPSSNNKFDRSEARLELGFQSDKLLVGMVSNLNRSIKGVSYFLDAIPHILKSVPSARFVIFGRGKEEPALREQARSLQIEECLVFAGFRSDIERFYTAMDLSVLTSLSEGLSISLLESMNHGVPVVVTRVGGNAEVVVDGETGYLVPPRDTAGFVDRVVKLLRDPNLRAQMGDAGRRRIEGRFHMKRTAERYLRVYEDLLASERRRGGGET